MSSRPCRVFRSPWILAAVLLAAGIQARAQQAPASLYEATVPLVSNSERGRTEAFAEAMRQVLVRATGRAQAPQEPTLAPLVQDAARYVQLYRQAPGGMLFVGFDGRRIEQLIAAADPSQVREVTVAISGIASVGVYADVTARLEALTQIGKLHVVELSGSTVVYRARARGELAQLEQAIASIAGLQPDTSPRPVGGAPAGMLRYRYMQ